MSSKHFSAIFTPKIGQNIGKFPYFHKIANISKPRDLLSGVRNTLETPNLDQAYHLEVSLRLQKDFSKF